MFKKIMVILLLALSVNAYASNKWRKVTDATYSSLSDVFFLNENLGWIAGSSGTLLRTTDGGQTWEEPIDTLPVIATMYSVYFVNENLGFAGGHDDLLLKSTDGGQSWSEVEFTSIGGDVRGIYFADENTGWVLSGASSGGQVMYTTDGGATWTAQFTESSVNIKAMDFHSPNHGVCVGGKSGNFAFYYTSDGQTWTKAPTPTGIPGVYSRTDIYGVGMASDSVACATGWGSSAAGLQPAFTLRTSDGGANWTYETQAEENRLYNNMYDIEFKDELTGIAVGGSVYKGGVAYQTVDGGKNWREITLPVGFTGKSISIVNDKICIVGGGGGIVISDDGGNTWQLATEIPSSTLYIIDIIGDNTLIASGFYGLFMRSDDMGETWNASYVADKNVCPTVSDVSFLDENIGFVAQRNRVVAKTIDGGKTWTQIMKDTMSTFVNNYGIQFLDENTGFVVGKCGSNVSAFYKTTDGGQTWTSLIADPNLTNELNTVYFFDANNGVVAGDESALAYTTDGGVTWTKIVPNNSPAGVFDYEEIEFLNDNFGLCGGEQLIKSNDGGKTWEYVAVPDLPNKIKGIAIVDEQNWFLAGNKYLFQTVDGGSTWANVVDLDVVTALQTYDVIVDDGGYPWLACGSSEIYTVAPIVSVEKVENNLLDKFSLEANYPNPFNPSTKIRYSIPKGLNENHVSLKVFNMLGQEVATLVNKSQKSGIYEVEFNASKLASGIYIYTLRSAGLSQSRKMLLVK